MSGNGLRAGFGVLVAAGVLLAGGASAQTLRVGVGEDPQVLDPAKSTNLGERQVFTAICDKLVDIAPDGSIIPELATEWTLSDDHKSLTMKLRPGVVFHDGEPFNAAAVKFNIERAKTLDGSRRKSELSPVETVEAVDDLTVKFTMAAPYAPLVAQLTDRAGMMISPKAASAMSADEFALHPVCSGPFTFVEHIPQERVVVKRFDKYWKPDAIHFDEIRYMIMPDALVRLSNVQSGQLDIAERLQASDLKRGEEDARIKMYQIPGLAFNFLHINTGTAPRNDTPLTTIPKLREALELSIDRTALVQAISDGVFLPGNQPVPPTSRFYIKEFPIPGRDVEKARALVTEAGFDRVPVRLLILNETLALQGAQVVQAMARDAGFDIAIEPAETGAGEEAYFSGNFEMFWGLWSGRVDPDGNIANWLTCEGAQNKATGQYCNPEVDKFIMAARSASDFDERYKNYLEAAKLWKADRPIIPTFHLVWIYATSAKLEGFTPHVDSLIRIDGLTMAP